jgi:hypothetical protein
MIRRSLALQVCEGLIVIGDADAVLPAVGLRSLATGKGTQHGEAGVLQGFVCALRFSNHGRLMKVAILKAALEGGASMACQ